MPKRQKTRALTTATTSSGVLQVRSFLKEAEDRILNHGGNMNAICRDGELFGCKIDQQEFEGASALHVMAYPLLPTWESSIERGQTENLLHKIVTKPKLLMDVNQPWLSENDSPFRGVSPLWIWIATAKISPKLFHLLSIILQNINRFHPDLNVKPLIESNDVGATALWHLVYRSTKDKRYRPLVEFVLRNYPQATADIDFAPTKGPFAGLSVGLMLISENYLDLFRERVRKGDVINMNTRITSEAPGRINIAVFLAAMAIRMLSSGKPEQAEAYWTTFRECQQRFSINLDAVPIRWKFDDHKLDGYIKLGDYIKELERRMPTSIATLKKSHDVKNEKRERILSLQKSLEIDNSFRIPLHQFKTAGIVIPWQHTTRDFMPVKIGDLLTLEDEIMKTEEGKKNKKQLMLQSIFQNSEEYKVHAKREDLAKQERERIQKQQQEKEKEAQLVIAPLAKMHLPTTPTDDERRQQTRKQRTHRRNVMKESLFPLALSSPALAAKSSPEKIASNELPKDLTTSSAAKENAAQSVLTTCAKESPEKSQTDLTKNSTAPEKITSNELQKDLTASSTAKDNATQSVLMAYEKTAPEKSHTDLIKSAPAKNKIIAPPSAKTARNSSWFQTLFGRSSRIEFFTLNSTHEVFHSDLDTKHSKKCERKI